MSRRRPTRLSTCAAIVLGVGVVGVAAGPAYANTLTYSCTADGVTSTAVVDLTSISGVNGSSLDSVAVPGDSYTVREDLNVTNEAFIQPFAAPGNWDRVDVTLTDVDATIEDPEGATAATIVGVITNSWPRFLSDDHRGNLNLPFTDIGSTTVGEHWVAGDYTVHAPTGFTLTLDGEADGVAAGTVVADCSYVQGPTVVETFTVEGTTPEPTDPEPTTPEPTTPEPTTPEPTTPEPTTPEPTTPEPTTPEPTTPEPTTPEPTTPEPTTPQPTTPQPTDAGSGDDDGQTPTVPAVVQTDGVAGPDSSTPTLVLGSLTMLVAAAGVVLVRLRRRES